MRTDLEIPRRARRLSDDHRQLERTFDELLARARGGDWHDLDEVWDAFVGDLEDHFAFEETTVFPAFGERDARCRSLVDRLVHEHAEIRRLVDDLGVQVQLHEIKATTVEALIDKLRRHAELENAEVYPWVDLRTPREDFSTRHAAW